MKSLKINIFRTLVISVLTNWLLAVILIIILLQKTVKNEEYNVTSTIDKVEEVTLLDSLNVEPNTVEAVQSHLPIVNEYVDDIDYLARCVEAEAGNQDEYGKRLVIDVILNRAYKEGKTTTEIINKPNQFQVVNNGSINNVKYDESLLYIIQDECFELTNSQALYFRTDHYHTFGTPLFQYKDHYFSKE